MVWAISAGDVARPAIASLSADSAAGHYKVCRYTPGRSEDANSDNVADGDKPLSGNIGHPLVYRNVLGL